MAKIELKFLCSTDDGSFIKTKLSKKNIWIEISYDNINRDKLDILLDKSTAIKFAKTLRTEINKIT